ncbi:MAG: alpha/beta hydrolase [Geminicoccaceae bacterium]
MALRRLTAPNDPSWRIEPTVDHVQTLPGGKRLGIAEFGPRGRLPIVYCHGFLGSRLEPGAAGQQRSCIISFDRPSYGHSTPQPDPSLAAWGSDASAAVDALGVSTCVVAGSSAGAPYALALAAALGEARVPRVVLAGGIAGHEVVETGGGTALVLGLLGRGGTPTSRLLRRLLRFALITGVDNALLRAIVSSEREALERLGLSPDVLRRRLLQSMRTGSRGRLEGALADARLLSRPWDFDLGRVRSEVLVLHGAEDPVVPPSHAHWYKAHLRRARVEIVPGELHLSLCFRSARVMVDTAGAVGRRLPA